MLATPEHRTRFYRALEPGRVDATDVIHFDNGHSLSFEQLPTSVIDLNEHSIEDIAILSWRWDVDPRTKSSRNAYVACQEAKRQGVRYLLLDKVSVNQDQTDAAMLIERLAFSQLYGRIPVLAAYDDATPTGAFTADVHGTPVPLGSPLSRIMRRPWIFHEVSLYRSNPTKVTYVGHIPDLGCHKTNGFLHMAPAMWETTLTQTILYTLAGIVSMHHVDDLRFIMPRYFDLLSAAHSRMSVSDFLLTAALLAGHSKRSHQRVNNDQAIDQIRFDRYRIGAAYTPDDLPKTQDYYTRRDIYLGQRKVAEWQTRHKFYPFEDLRVWFTVSDTAERSISDLLGVKPSSVDEPDGQPFAPEPVLQGPRLSMVIHERDLLG